MIDAEKLALQYRLIAAQGARAALDAQLTTLERQRQSRAARKPVRHDARVEEQLAVLKPILSEARKAEVAATRAFGSLRRRREAQRNAE